VLIDGDSEDWWDDRILDLKRQNSPSASVSDPAFSDPAPFLHHGERVATGQRALALHVDDHLGFLVSGNDAFSVRERSPWKEALQSEDIESMDALESAAEDWGLILANAHARADNDFDDMRISYSFEEALSTQTAAEHGAYRDLVLSVSRPYATYMEQGWLAFQAFVEDTYDFDCSSELDDG
jgi:uncharacterized protein (DUF2252 family)